MKIRALLRVLESIVFWLGFILFRGIVKIVIRCSNPLLLLNYVICAPVHEVKAENSSTINTDYHAYLMRPLYVLDINILVFLNFVSP